MKYLISIMKYSVVDFCTSSPCQNGGTCDNNLDGTDYECVCDEGYKGKSCEAKIVQGAISKLFVCWNYLNSTTYIYFLAILS